MVPGFTHVGLLPPGEHATDLSTIRARLGWNARRQRLIRGLEEALSLMGSCGVKRVYLGGEFTTVVPLPSRVEGCYDLQDGAGHEDLLKLDPIYPPSPWHLHECLVRFAVVFFPAATRSRGPGQPFLDLFKRGWDRPGPDRGVLVLDPERGTT
jgi:hypothetical protein